MDAQSVLAVRVKVDGLAKATAQVEALEADLRKAAKTTDSTGRSLDGLSGDLDKATKATNLHRDAQGRLRNEMGRFATDAEKAAKSVNLYRDAQGRLRNEMGRFATDAEKARLGIGGLGQETDRTTQTITRAQRVMARAADEVQRTGKVSRRTADDLNTLRTRGVEGLDSDFARAAKTVEKASGEIDTAGRISRKTARDLEALGSGGDRGGGGIRALQGALSGLPGGMGAAGAAASFLAVTLIALGGPLVAVISALGPLVGLAAAGGAGLLAAAQGFGVFKLATMGVAAALKEESTAHFRAAKSAISGAQQQRAAAQAIAAAQEGVHNAKEQVRSASLRVADAERGEKLASEDLTSAQDDARKAQQALTQARGQARRELEDMRNALVNTVDDEKQAGIDLGKAKEDLARVMADPNSTQLDKDQAILNVAKAEHHLTEATRERVRAQHDAAKAEHAGVEGSKTVTSAKDAVAAADKRVTDAARAAAAAQRNTTEAQHALREAQRDVVRATKAVADAQIAARSSAEGAAVGASNLHKAMNALPAPAQAFVRQLIALKPKLTELKAIAAGGFFAGASKGITAALGSFGAIKTVVGETSTTLGTFTHRAGELVGSKAFSSDIQKIGHNNATVLQILGDAVLHVVSALRHVTAAAGPLTVWLAKVVDGWAQSADKAAAAGRESGKLAGFFERTRAVAERLGSILGHLAHGLLGVGKAGTDSGNSILASIDGAAKRFDEWANSANGQTALKRFFKESKDLAAALLPVLSNAAGAIGLLAIRTLPLTEALTVLGPLAGPLAQAFVFYKIAATGAAVASKVLAAATWLVNTAMTANPVLLVVAAIAALTAAFIIAYRKSETFRDIVNGALKAVADVATTAFGIVKTSAEYGLLGPIGLIITRWGTAKTVLSGVWNFLASAASSVFGAILSATRTTWNAIGNAVTAPIRAARDVFPEIGAGMANRLAAAWSAIQSAAVTAWGAIREAILAPIRGARDLIPDIVGGMASRLAKGWETITGAVAGFAGDVKDKIESAFKGAANLVIKFVNAIIGAINLIPGVPNIEKIKPLAQGGTTAAGNVPDNAHGFARGGAIARGGLVDKPMIMMGEEAPRHPEFVIPTNPAYRGRARGLMAAAAKAIGYAKGGIVQGRVSTFGPPMEPAGITAYGYSSAMPGIAVNPHGGATTWNDSAALALAEKVMKVTIAGHSAMLKVIDKGPAIPGRMIDVTGAGAAKLGFSQRAFPTDAIGTASLDTGGGGGILGAIGGAIGGAVSDAAGAVGDLASGAFGLLQDGASALLGQLPGVGGLPDWLKGMGSYVIDKVTGYIKDQAASLLGLGGGGGGKPQGPAGLGSFDGLSVAKWIIPELQYARQHGWRGHITSGYRPPDQIVNSPVAAPQGHSEHQGTQYPHGAVDFGGPFDPAGLANKLAFIAAVAGYKGLKLLPAQGFRDDGHMSGTGHAIGGILGKAGGAMGGLPFGGSFATGGVVPGPLGAPVAIVAHGGETVTPPGDTSALERLAAALEELNDTGTAGVLTALADYVSEQTGRRYTARRLTAGDGTIATT